MLGCERISIIREKTEERETRRIARDPNKERGILSHASAHIKTKLVLLRFFKFCDGLVQFFQGVHHMAATKDEPMDNDTLLGEVSVNNAQRQVWLLKLPKVLNDVWRSAPPESQLGYILQDQTTNQVPMVISWIHCTIS